jgi:selenocysteine-specific elongation factor
MIIGTAGHIDHGKSALVRALTGQAMDRLAEEQRRGITIDLNFAPLLFPGLPPVGVVDVPGHEDFIRTMVAGASGVDLVLLVIDAAEGPMPQTLEHLAIVEQLGVPRGIPVFTKCDLVDAEWLDLVELEFAPRLAASSVQFAEPARVSAITGEGIDALRDRLRAAITTDRRPPDHFRMPVDRAFSLAGVGTVLTGTAWSGAVGAGDAVRLLPSGLEGRVRSVAIHGAAVEKGGAGMRVAVGLAGVERSAVHRGETLVGTGDSWEPTRVLDVELNLLPDAPRPLAARSRVRLHLGTSEILARVHPRAPIAQGEIGWARLTLESPTLARGGDRLVLRSYSPVTTIGGGRVLDPIPPRRAGWPDGLAAGAPAERLLAHLGRRPEGVEQAILSQLLGLPPQEADRLAQKTPGVRRIGTRWVDSARVRALEAAALATIERFHQENPSQPGLSLGTLRQGLRGPDWLASAALESLQKRGELEVREGLAALPGFQAVLAGGISILDRLADAIGQGGLMPPTTPELASLVGEPSIEPALRLLAKAGRIERVELDRYFAAGPLKEFEATIRAVAEAEGEVTPGALRDRLGITRKYLIPLLEWADRKGITRRDGDRRVLVVK